MGVSLERVQFKFASIIGELCSEPDVLSQFAVWLDLRLAEYKLKGAISLDCSGEEPNPLWLKGINKRNKKAADQPVSPHRPDRTSREWTKGPFPHHMTSPDHMTPSPVPLGQTDANASLGQRLSPDVIIKEEPSEIYPIQMHIHQNSSTSFSGGSKRKRSAAETLTSDDWSQEIQDISSLSSSPKHKRFSSTADSPSNQSLMSVIGGFQDSAEESISKGDNSYNPLESTGTSTNNTTAMYQSNMSTDFTAEASCSFAPSSSSQDFDISIQDTLQQIQPVPSESNSTNDVEEIPVWKDLSSRPPHAGVIPSSVAEKFDMVELVPATGVYLSQASYNMALTKCCLPPRKTRPKKVEQVKPNDGRPAARYLLGVFFSAEDLANSTTSCRSGRPKLDDRIIQAIKVLTGYGQKSDDVLFAPSTGLRVNRSVERCAPGNESKAADSVSCKQARRLRIRRINEIPKKSVVNMVNAATTFERWLWMQPYNDLRPINEIPTEELDAYLSEFFANIKTESGSDFKYDSFLTLRSHLERFLKETGYPCSIITDHEFRNSQAVYKSRTSYLTSLKHSNTGI